MGFFSKKKMNTKASFQLGVEDVFPLSATKDLAVVGTVRGEVCVGANVFLDNPGCEDDEMGRAIVRAIEAGQRPATRALDRPAALRLELCDPFRIRTGTVVFSEDRSGEDVYYAYLAAIGNTFVYQQNAELDQDALDDLSIAELAEIWRLYLLRLENEETEGPEKDQGKKQDEQRKIGQMRSSLCEKILNAQTLYCLYDEHTGEPALFSRTVDQGEAYYCSPPEILVITEAYLGNVKRTDPTSRLFWEKIERGEDGIGIVNLLGNAFHLNGATGVRVVRDEVVLRAEELVPPPDYSDTPAINIPVTNPALKRWLLLLEQLEQQKTDQADTLARLYTGFALRACAGARLLLPIRTEGQFPSPDESGRLTLEKNMTIAFPTVPGHGNERQAARVYTDWKELRKAYGEGWDGLIVRIGDLIGSYDIVVNLTEKGARCYIDRETYEKQLMHSGESGKVKEES